jgi:hypothetical protein
MPTVTADGSTPPTSDRASDTEGVVDTVADGVEQAVRNEPLIETVTQLGWIAKGLVYFLMGATAVGIARQQPTDDEASPKGALGRVLEQPGGRVLLGVLAVGLVLYCVWRILSVAVIRGHDLAAWLDRIGYAFSAVFYALLALVAGQTVLKGGTPGRDNTVERLSRSLMDTGAGRVVVVIGGIAVVVVGAYFVIGKGIMRKFVDDLSGVSRTGGDAIGRTLIVSGVAGWIGRGAVTVLVGVFLVRAAVQFDPADARGFDGSLRRVATSSWGSVLVWFCAVGLVLYGAFCLLSHRRRHLEDNS